MRCRTCQYISNASSRPPSASRTDPCSLDLIVVASPYTTRTSSVRLMLSPSTASSDGTDPQHHLLRSAAANLADLSAGPLRVAINALLAQVHYLLRSSFDCSLLLPFLVSPARFCLRAIRRSHRLNSSSTTQTQAWTNAARCLLKFLEVAIDFGDLSRAQTLLSEVGVFRYVALAQSILVEQRLTSPCLAI